MDFFNFLYNILLLLLYCIPLTLGFVLYSQRRKNIYLYTCILFIAFIVDNVTIYMTEFFPWFSRLYDRMLLSVPTVKTLLYAVTLGSTLLITSMLLKLEKIYVFWSALAFIVLFQLYTPILPNGPWKVWIYYFPIQLFMFCLGIYGVHTQRKHPDSYLSEFDRNFFWVLVFYAVMAVAIIIEDSIVIFHVDAYPPLEVDIQNRSVTQDIMNIGLSFYAIRLLYDKLSQAISASPDETGQNKKMSDSPAPTEHHTEQRAESTAEPKAEGSSEPAAQQKPNYTDDKENTVLPVDMYSKQYLFSKKYQFTAREEEILLLLLGNKSNQEISDTLFISIGTTKTHTHNIFQKLGVRKRQQLFELYENFEPPKDSD